MNYENSMPPDQRGGHSLDMELAAAINTEVIRSKKSLIHDLELRVRL